jgi:hypothetical protein
VFGKRTLADLRVAPQGLKPPILLAHLGPTEVVPFYKTYF